MNQEQRQIQFEKLNKLEGLLAYAVKAGETEEAERINSQLQSLVEDL